MSPQAIARLLDQMEHCLDEIREVVIARVTRNMTREEIDTAIAEARQGEWPDQIHVIVRHAREVRARRLTSSISSTPCPAGAAAVPGGRAAAGADLPGAAPVHADAARSPRVLVSAASTVAPPAGSMPPHSPGGPPDRVAAAAAPTGACPLALKGPAAAQDLRHALAPASAWAAPTDRAHASGPRSAFLAAPRRGARPSPSAFAPFRERHNQGRHRDRVRPPASAGARSRPR